MPYEYSDDQKKKYVDDALAGGIPQNYIDSFLKANTGPNGEEADYNRINSSYQSKNEGQGEDSMVTGGKWVPNPNYNKLPPVSGTGGTSGANGGPSTFGSPGPSVTDYTRDGGAASTNAMMDEITAALKNINAQPDVNVDNIDPGTIPTFTVPGEDLSPAIDNTLMDLMEGQDPYGMTGVLKGLLDRTAGGGINSTRLANRNEQARENLTAGETAALADMKGSLADRGLISTPGAPQGMELDSTSRAFEPLQRAYLNETRQAFTDESQQADAEEMSAIAAATGWSKDQIDRRLGAARTAQDRQQMLSDIAIQSLNSNMEWNKFLAEFGLQREQVAEQIRQGRLAQIQPLLSMFEALVSQSRGGYIGNR